MCIPYIALMLSTYALRGGYLGRQLLQGAPGVPLHVVEVVLELQRTAPEQPPDARHVVELRVGQRLLRGGLLRLLQEKFTVDGA